MDWIEVVTTIVLDVTAGEGDGREALQAAALASLELDLDLCLVGDETDITEQLATLAHDAERLRVIHAPDRVDSNVSARVAIGKAPRSSIAVGLDTVARTRDTAFVSAGHAGAIVLEATQRLTPIAGVKRAALAAVYPTLKLRGERQDPFALLLDVGATVDCSDDELVAFAVMGSAYARRISVNPHPRVALLSNGTNAEVAPPPINLAHRRLAEGDFDFEYIGCIRADQITRGDADVIVSDGYTGDVVIRTLEGVASTAHALLRQASDRFRWRLGVSMLGRGIERLRELIDWENYGGAPLLGFQSPVIVTQSNSHRRAFFNAIRLAAKVERTGAIAEVTDCVERLQSTRGRAHD